MANPKNETAEIVPDVIIADGTTLQVKPKDKAIFSSDNSFVDTTPQKGEKTYRCKVKTFFGKIYEPGETVISTRELDPDIWEKI